MLDPSKVFCYFVRLTDGKGRRLTALRWATQFKGVLKNRLIRMVTDALKIIEDKVFKLDMDFNLLIDAESIHILRPSGFEFVGQLQAAVLAAVPENIKALQGGAMALFGEKYGEKVRVVQVPGFSKELCGGTHCKATGDIGVFRITSESGIAAGVRRIEALTGAAALRHFIESERTVAEISGMLKAKPAEVAGKAERLVTQLKEQEKEIARLKGQLTVSKAKDITSEIREVEGIQVLSKRADPMSIDDLRNFAESLRSQMKSGVVAAGTGADEKAAIVVMVTKDLAFRLDAREIIREIAPLVDGRGGGRADMAQAGGKRPEGLAEALDKVAGVVGEMAKRDRGCHSERSEESD